ncbi:MAG: hypothetical protein ACRDL8_01975, partial [Solirubrobacteraceae bacterium]
GALAAAQDMAGSASATATSDGTTIAQTNYPGATVTVSEPTTNEAKVIVNASTPSFFGRALGLTSAKVSASAVAGVTQASTTCSSPGSSCLAIFAMDSNCSDNGINFTGGGGNNINGGIWSNGTLGLNDGGGDTIGPSYYGNGPGCKMTETGGGDQINGTYEHNATNDPPGSAAEPPTTTWPIDYSKDFPACGGAGELSCSGPCDVSASPCPAANRTPSFCTKATNAASETLVSWNPGTLKSGNVYCDIGSGTASDPTTWTGAITADQSGRTPIKSTYVAGSFSVGGGSELEACGYSTSGYLASGCNSSIPAPLTNNYPIVYAVGNSHPFDFPGGGGSLTGDVFCPNGSITWNAGGTTIVGLLEAQDVIWEGGGMTGDGPPVSTIGSSSVGTVALLQ